MESRSIFDLQTPSGATLTVQQHRFGKSSRENGLHIAFVAGVRGDAPEGIRVAFRLMQALKGLEPSLEGVVDVYPCINPLAAEQGRRLWPGFDIDQNRQFPGNPQGHPPARLGHQLMNALRGVDVLVELRGARPGFVELPHVMIRTSHENNVVCEGVTLLDIARQCNTTLVWKRTSGTKADKTLANQFKNVIVLEGGQGNRLTDDVGDIFGDGCLYLLTRTTVLPETLLPFPWMAMEDPIVLEDNQVKRMRVNSAGLFLPSVRLSSVVQEGDEIGVVMDPKTSTSVETIHSTSSGIVIALRNQPVVSLGELVARIQSMEQE